MAASFSDATPFVVPGASQGKAGFEPMGAGVPGGDSGSSKRSRVDAELGTLLETVRGKRQRLSDIRANIGGQYAQSVRDEVLLAGNLAAEVEEEHNKAEQLAAKANELTAELQAARQSGVAEQEEILDYLRQIVAEFVTVADEFEAGLSGMYYSTYLNTLSEEDKNSERAFVQQAYNLLQRLNGLEKYKGTAQIERLTANIRNMALALGSIPQQ